MSNSSPKPLPPPTTTTTTNPIDDWDKPLTLEEIQSIDAAIQAAEASSSSSSTRTKHPRSPPVIDEDDSRPTTRRKLPDSIEPSKGILGPGPGPGTKPGNPTALTPCRNNNNSAPRQASAKLNYPPINFGGCIVYSRTAREVEHATLQIWNFVEFKKRQLGRAVLGLDVEWRPNFTKGVPPRKVAVMQICGDMNHCYVLHILHSGIPNRLRCILEDSNCVKVGVGIGNDAVKVFHDYNVSINSVEDLSGLANQRAGGRPKQWGLASLVETFTCKQLKKPKKIKLGNWEAGVLSKAQLQYAATDAFASWYLYEVLTSSFLDLSQNQNKN